MSEFKDIEVTQSVLENNNRQAEELRKELKLYRFSNITSIFLEHVCSRAVHAVAVQGAVPFPKNDLTFSEIRHIIPGSVWRKRKSDFAAHFLLSYLETIQALC